MTPQQCEMAAGALSAARKDNIMMAGLDEGLTPATMAEAYAIQDAFMRQWDVPVAGWKVAATAEKIQQIYGVDEPFCGPFYTPTTFTSPATPNAETFGIFCIESEFAFRFSATLTARERAYGREEILEAVEAVMPAFELISPRFDSMLQDRAALAAADCAMNGGFVLGAPTADWRGLDLAAHRVCLRIDGEVRAEGTGSDVLGHPFNVLDWLVNHLSRRGIDLNAGEVVSTGTCTGFICLEQGQKAVADYGVLGTVEVTFI